MSTSGSPSRSVTLAGVGPSRWWQLVAAAEDVPRAWDDSASTTLVRATSDEDEQITATHPDAARRSVAGWDGDLQSLSVERGPAGGAPGYRITWAFERGSAPRVEVSGPDETAVASYARSLEGQVGPLAEGMAAEDAAATPPGRAGRIWVRMDALGTGIAVGISVVMILAVAGAIWAWSTR